MKKYSLLFAVLTVFALILAACGNNDDSTGETEDVESDELAYQPEDIDPDKDVCEVCGMAIADDQHATQIVLKNDRSVKFDDVGDLFVWLEENGTDEVGAKFVRDFSTKEWILLEDATFVFDEKIATPMGYGFISFKNSADAETYMEDNGFGELLTAKEMADREWGSDHDHGDHDDHADHDEHGDDDHGFHTDGFDMHLAGYENVTVAEETTLEVHLSIHEDALENANVRYEIWQGDDKDTTVWVDAAESDAGVYVADHVFEEAETYHIQVHVKDDADLHEHMVYEVNVKE
jgi:copper chaperone NosL